MGAGGVGRRVKAPIGIMGGTFDPIHVGHLAAAEEAREALGLGRILFVPAGRPPHKAAADVTPAGDRAAMVALAIEDNPAFELSRIEIDRPGPSWTVDTVEQLRNSYPDVGPNGLVLILSAETFLDLPAWHDPERLLGLCRIAIMPREGYPAPDRDRLDSMFPGFSQRIVLLEGPRLGVSSTGIRQRVGAGRSIRYLVPPEVARYIADRALYA